MVSFYLGSSIKIENWRQELDFAKLGKTEQDFCVKFFKNKENMNEKCGLLKKVFEFPDYLFCDDLNIRNSDMKLLLDYLKSKNILLFYVTHDIEVTPYFSYLIVIKNNCCGRENRIGFKRRKVNEVTRVFFAVLCKYVYSVRVLWTYG